MGTTDRWPVWVATLAALFIAAPAQALKFDPVDPAKLPPGVRSALWVRDCGAQGFRDSRCAEHEKSFSKGDGARLAFVLNTRYDEVWLASGGGNLDEGIAVGEVLRRAQATVRVPSGYRCVSSCTVAFLGGVFRYVDPDATYQVHAASRFLMQTLDGPSMRAVVENPAAELAEWASIISMGLTTSGGRVPGSRERAQQMFTHFQRALHPLGQLPAALDASNRQRLASWARAAPQSAYRDAISLQADAERIQREGGPAAQEILMRLERDAMAQAIDELTQMVPGLGSRAGPALKILEAMYSSRITGTAVLSRETLVQMGYVTELFDPSKP